MKRVSGATFSTTSSGLTTLVVAQLSCGSRPLAVTVAQLVYSPVSSTWAVTDISRFWPGWRVPTSKDTLERPSTVVMPSGSSSVTRTPVAAPSLIAFNDALAAEIGVERPEDAAVVFGGNRLPEGAAPLAQVYAGHQFGHWSPQLGDGRAVLLGEVVGPDGRRRDIQLKGAGRTPYSRMGDGRSALGPVLREYLMSEWMAALGVPTTRALAAVRSGERVLRQDGPEPGGVFTRVAASHIRVGTFQVLAARGDTEGLAALLDHARARHYPDAAGVEGVLEAVVAAQARLVARWMGLGFIHGVMNTDNMAVSGETIDYGPCAVMDGFHPMRVYSSIDRQGRYAYGAQPQIAVWNLAQLATALLPLMPDTEAAVPRFTEIVQGFAEVFEPAWRGVFAAKLGLEEVDVALVEDLLTLMARDGADFTNTFRGLAGGGARDEVMDREGFDGWAARWRALGPDEGLMARTNPQVVPRLHLIQKVIEAAYVGDDGPFHALQAAVTRPFEAPADPAYLRPPSEDEAVERTFCGT